MRLIDADNVRGLFDAEFKETRKLILAGETHLDNLAEGFTEADRVLADMPCAEAVSLHDIYRVIAGHSYYHGDRILAALTCIAEGKEVNPVLPTDLVPVERCKDCKYRDGTPGQPNILCAQMHEDDFCSYGERRAEKEPPEEGET